MRGSYTCTLRATGSGRKGIRKRTNMVKFSYIQQRGSPAIRCPNKMDVMRRAWRGLTDVGRAASRGVASPKACDSEPTACAHLTGGGLVLCDKQWRDRETWWVEGRPSGLMSDPQNCHTRTDGLRTLRTKERAVLSTGRTDESL